MTLRRVLIAALLVSLVLAPSPARSHGDWGHVQVTRWAIESLPPGPLKEFFAEPAVREAALFGAAFPDSGYWADGPAEREYGEYTHWEPFIQAFVEHIRTNQPPPFAMLEQRKLVAFLMGCGAHGLQDEIFDSLFLFQVDEHDGGNQEDADGGTDFFLVEDGVLPFDLVEFVPMDALLPL
ncbi:MAG: zinc dependent phospholipase C family protein [Candidatus Binatia bacterium]|nr:zinc dependent phospholipase C family protein [Candidatus Binatia bacterium]